MCFGDVLSGTIPLRFTRRGVDFLVQRSHEHHGLTYDVGHLCARLEPCITAVEELNYLIDVVVEVKIERYAPVSFTPNIGVELKVDTLIEVLTVVLVSRYKIGRASCRERV